MAKYRLDIETSAANQDPAQAREQLARWVDFQLSTISQAEINGFSLGREYIVLIPSGGNVLSLVSRADNSEIEINADYYASAEHITDAILKAIQSWR